LQLVINPYDGHPAMSEDDTKFDLALYGWNEEKDNRLHPIRDIHSRCFPTGFIQDRSLYYEQCISSDQMMLTIDWMCDTYRNRDTSNIVSGWEKCVKQGKESFDYMVRNFSKMVKEDSIPQFRIYYSDAFTKSFVEDISTLHGDEIEQLLIPWIRSEWEDMTEHSMWRPFRDTYNRVHSYMGYRKLFKYKQYYFQVIIESYRDYEDAAEEDTHIELVLFGWKEDTDTMLQPSKRISILVDQLIPDAEWKYDTQ
jgi:hypothetical protein